MPNPLALRTRATLTRFNAVSSFMSRVALHFLIEWLRDFIGNSVQDVHSQEAKSAAELFGIDLSGLTGQAGFNCSPLAIIGLSNGGSCQTQPVCCDDNHFSEYSDETYFTHVSNVPLDGLIAVGCSPINVGL